MLDPNKVALRLFSWRIERASPPSLWPPAGGILADFWGVGSLEKRERRLEGKMQTVNSKKKKEKEKLHRYIATLWLGLSRGPERRSLRNFCYLDAFLVEWCGGQSLD